MAGKEIRTILPTNTKLGFVLILWVTALILILAILFVVKFLQAGSPGWLLGSLLAAELFLFGVALALFARFFMPMKEVAEPREDEFLW